MGAPVQILWAKSTHQNQSMWAWKGALLRAARPISASRYTYPKEWMMLGQQHHLPRKLSGRGVVRVLQPEGACAASLADELVVDGVPEPEAIEIGQMSIALFARILQAGVTPAELHRSPLDGVGEEETRP